MNKEIDYFLNTNFRQNVVDKKIFLCKATDC